MREVIDDGGGLTLSRRRPDVALYIVGIDANVT